jgi:hypothetical protein
MRSSHLAVLAVALSSIARGQVLYQTSFDTGSGWVFAASNAEGTQWNVDALPSFPGSGPVHSAPSSLNYNNDVDYAGSALLSEGLALSPYVDLSSASGTPTLTFWCNNLLVEGMCAAHESVVVRMATSTASKFAGCLTCATCYADLAPISPCNPGFWHQHSIPLDASWGSVRVSFKFRGDAMWNGSPGIFIDDLSIVDVLPTTTYCTAKLNSQGCAAVIATSGSPNVAGTGSFVLSCAQVLNQKNGLFFYGINGRHNGAFLGGTLCVKQPVRRTTLVSSGGNPATTDDCSGVLSFDFNAWITAAHDPALTAGVDVDGQYWYRDPADPFRTGLSNGVEFTVVP